MKLDLEDIVNAQSEMIAALNDYIRVLKMPNCNGCVRGLDICPAEGEPLRINCPAFHDKKNGPRQAEEPTMTTSEPEPDFMNPPVVDSGVCEPAEQEAPAASVPNDPKLQNYLKHPGSEA